jgi:uncharacterized protein YkwD
MSTGTFSRVAMALAASAPLAFGSLASQSASGSAPPSRAACDGVRLLSAPYIAIGIGGVTTGVTAPANDLVLCQPVDLPRSVDTTARGSRGCRNARVPGARLRPRLAAKAIRCLINHERSARGLGGLAAHHALKKAAKRHSRRMVSSGCFSHICPGEPDLVARVTSSGYLPCTCSWSVGENIAWGRGRRGTPAAIVDAWMASPPHRALILTAPMRDVGVGARAGKPGASKAAAATYTADFGFRN